MTFLYDAILLLSIITSGGITFFFIKKIYNIQKSVELYQIWVWAWGLLTIGFILYLLIDLKVFNQLYAGYGIRIVETMVLGQFLVMSIFSRLFQISYKTNITIDVSHFYNFGWVIINIVISSIIIFSTVFIFGSIGILPNEFANSYNTGYNGLNSYFSIIELIISIFVAFLLPWKKIIKDDRILNTEIYQFRYLKVGMVIYTLGRVFECYGIVIANYTIPELFIIDWVLFFISIVIAFKASVFTQPISLKDRLDIIQEYSKR